LETVASAPSVSMRELPDGGLAFNVQPPPRRKMWAVPVLCMVFGAACVAGGYLMHRYNPGLRDLYTWPPRKLIVLGSVAAGMGPVMLLIFAVQGPPKNVELEAHPGRLKADRSIAGDRVVSNYSADEVKYLFVEQSTLVATTRMGDQQLMAFGDRRVNGAIATLLASRLWGPDNLLAGNDPLLGRWVVMPEPRAEPPPADRG
jgi:hypothetical protein